MTDRDSLRIRRCTPADRPRMREICAVCDDPARPERLQWVLPMYLDYYVEFCPESCFVAADASDAPVGYILCAPSARDYRRSFIRGGYLKTLLRFRPSMALAFLLQPLLAGRAYGAYPAHLHIDILPAYRRAGLGRRLMDALIDHLAQLGVPGVMLGCAASNTSAQRFYEACGFACIGHAPETVNYGLLLAPAPQSPAHG